MRITCGPALCTQGTSRAHKFRHNHLTYLGPRVAGDAPIPMLLLAIQYGFCYSGMRCGVGMTLDLEERNSVQDEGENPPPNSDTCESEPEHNRIFVRPR